MEGKIVVGNEKLGHIVVCLDCGSFAPYTKGDTLEQAKSELFDHIECTKDDVYLIHGRVLEWEHKITTK
ncbi:MAG: hypothetical protein ACXABY_03585 [Candidatus Thorarchaeota archaeon]